MKKFIFIILVLALLASPSFGALDYVRTSSQYVNFGDSNDFTPVLTDGFYWCGWFELDDITSGTVQMMFAKYAGVGGNEWYCRFIGDIKDLRVLIRDDGGTAYIGRYGQNTFTLSTGTPYFIEFIYDGGTTNAALKVYVNLTRWDDTDCGNGTFDNPLNANDDFTIGYSGHYGEYFDGKAWDCRIYNREPSLAERQAIYYNKGNDGILSGSMVRTQMMENKDGAACSGASAVVDISGRGNHGTPHGSNDMLYEAKAVILTDPIFN